MKTKNILLILGVLLAAWIGIGSQIPTILPVSPVTEFVDFLKGMRATGPLEVGPVGRNLKTWWNFEDFCGATNAGSPFISRGIWIPLVSGTGAGAFDWAGEISRPGKLLLATGTTTTGYASIATGFYAPKTFTFGGGVYTFEADISLVALSTVTEAYVFRLGFGDNIFGDATDGAYFEYTDVGGGTPTPNWYKCTASNSTSTKTDTAVAAVAGYTRLKIVVNAAGTSVEYFINGVSVGVVTTNIPTASTGGVIHIIKSAGTTIRYAELDWTWLHVDLTTSR